MNLLRAGELAWVWLTPAGMRRRRRPRVAIESTSAVPAWVLRIVCALVAAGCTQLVASHALHVILAVMIVGAIIIRPLGAAPVFLAGGAGLVMLTSGSDAFDPRVYVLVFGLHLVVELAAVIGDLPWSAPIERRILAAAAVPFLAIQALVQPIALAGAWVTAEQPPVVWLPVVAGVALAVMAWALLVRLGPGR